MQVQLIQFCFRDKQYLAFIYGIDVQHTGGLGIEALHITDPPARWSKLKDVLETVRIDGITTQTALGNKYLEPMNIAFLVKQLFSFQLFMLQQAVDILFFPRHSAGYVSRYVETAVRNSWEQQAGNKAAICFVALR